MSEHILEKLALEGGAPAISRPLTPRGHFGAEERTAALRVMDQAIAAGIAPVYGGEEETAFCKEFAAQMGGGFADAVNSGTTAVYVALRALELEPFTEVIVGPITDPGGMMPIVLCNCIPVVADTEPGSFNLSPASVESLISPLTSAIVVPHIAGEPVDMDAIMDIARRHHLKVVEDCAQAHGACWSGRRLGNFGDIAAFSMMHGKHTCTGGQGGIVFTRDEALYWKIRSYSDRGKPFGLPEGCTNPVASLNCNLEEVGCAIGREQLKKADAIADGRRRVAAAIREAVQREEIRCLSFPTFDERALPSFWFMRVRLDTSLLTCSKAEFCKALAAEGLPVNPHYNAFPSLMDWCQNKKVFGSSQYPWAAPEYKGDHERSYRKEDIPNAIQAVEDHFILYALESWTGEDIAMVTTALRKVWNAYQKR